MTKQRKDINTISDIELDAYIHALEILRARSAADPDDPTGYDYQAALHNDPAVGPCEHGSDLFLAWHRSHLYYFERLLQQSDPDVTADVTIPYWDWIHLEDDGAKFPARFALPKLSSPRSTAPAALPPDTLKIVNSENDIAEFGGYPFGDPRGDYGRLEYGPHNTMHGSYIGGAMGNPSTAAEDPIYFSFHCFIDLIWDQWQRRRGYPAPTSSTASLRGFLDKPAHAVQDFHTVSALGYEYLHTPKLTAAFAQPGGPTPPQPSDAGQPMLPQFSNTLESLAQHRALAWRLPNVESSKRRQLVALRGIAVPTAGSYMLRAYIHPRSLDFAALPATEKETYFLDYLTLWLSHGSHGPTGHGAHGGHGGHGDPGRPLHPPSATVRFDATEMLHKLAIYPISDLTLTLVYLPLTGADGVPQDPSALMNQVKIAEVLLQEAQ